MLMDWYFLHENTVTIGFVKKCLFVSLNKTRHGHFDFMQMYSLKK